MQTEDSKANEATNNHRRAFAERHQIIHDATNGLFEAIMKGAKSDGPLPPGMNDGITNALTLINCGLLALTEIADAQQRLANLAERDVSAEIAAMVDEQAEAQARVMVSETNKRSFIGQKEK